MNIRRHFELEPDAIVGRLHEDGSLWIDYRNHPMEYMRRLRLTAAQVVKLRAALAEPRPHGSPLPDVTR